MRKTLLSILSVCGIFLVLAPAAYAQCASVTLSFPPSVSVNERVNGAIKVTNCALERELVRINLTVVNETTGFTIFSNDVGTADLAAGQSKSLSVTFNTATATAGDYEATATATDVDGEVLDFDTVFFTVS